MAADVAPAWVNMRHPETGGTTTVPNDPDVVDAHAARGWEPYEPDDGEPVPLVNVNDDGTPAPWATLVHPATGATHDFPNNVEALAGARDAGWVQPNKDGSIPKKARTKAAREQGVDVDDLPEPAGDTASENNTESAGASAANNQEG